MSKKILFLFLLVFILGPKTSLAVEVKKDASQKPEYVEGEVLIKIKNPSSAKASEGKQIPNLKTTT